MSKNARWVVIAILALLACGLALLCVAASLAVVRYFSPPTDLGTVTDRPTPVAASAGRGGVLRLWGSEPVTLDPALVTDAYSAGYVLEILHTRTFATQFSSETNTGGVNGPEVVSDNPAWSRLQSLLRRQAESKQLASYGSGGVAREVFGDLLDGWRLVKMKAEFVLRED